MKFKIFRGVLYSDPRPGCTRNRFEEQVNAWLAKHPNINLIDTKLDTTWQDASGGYITRVTYTILYTEVGA